MSEGGNGLATPVAGDRAAPAGNRPCYASDAIVTAGLSRRDLHRLKERGFRIGEQSEGKLGASIVQLILPKGMSLTAARRIVSSMNRSATVDLDAYYYTDGGPESACSEANCAPLQMIGWTDASACGGAQCLVDTAIDLAHPALAGQPIELIGEPGGGAPPIRQLRNRPRTRAR